MQTLILASLTRLERFLARLIRRPRSSRCISVSLSVVVRCKWARKVNRFGCATFTRRPIAEWKLTRALLLPDFSVLTISTPALWCRVFRSRHFHPCHLVPRFPFSPFPFSPFQRPRQNEGLFVSYVTAAFYHRQRRKWCYAYWSLFASVCLWTGQSRSYGRISIG